MATMKLAVVSALFAVMVAVATANVNYKTVVTTVVNEDENPSCQQEMQPQRLQDCMMWMEERMQGGGGGRFGGGEQMMKEQCCNQLRMMDPQCICEALRMMMKQMQQQRGMMEQMEQMKRMVENLPQTCGIQSPSQCRMRLFFV